MLYALLLYLRLCIVVVGSSGFWRGYEWRKQRQLYFVKERQWWAFIFSSI